ncbi:NUDIX hydrolase [Elusimicrobiota bacterium]
MRQASVALILVPGSMGAELLLMKRAENPQDPWSGQIGLPGGRRDPEDKDFLATALRETKEETDIRLPEDALLGSLSDMRPRNRGLPPFVIRPFVFSLERKPEVIVSPEADYAFWIPISALRDSDGETRLHYRGANRKVRAFRPDKHVIWGITYRILTPFLKLAGKT